MGLKFDPLSDILNVSNVLEHEVSAEILMVNFKSAHVDNSFYLKAQTKAELEIIKQKTKIYFFSFLECKFPRKDAGLTCKQFIFEYLSA